MKNNKELSYLIITGVFIITIFTSVILVNLYNNNENDSYYGKADKEIDASIDDLFVKDTILKITTSGNPVKYCVKTTMSVPGKNNLCWKDIYNNEVSVEVYKNKKYYIWIKDINDNISKYKDINT